MALTLPPSVNYQNPVNSVPALFAQTPPELARMIPIEIDWATMGGANNNVSINLFGGAAATISQIVAISIDNSGCAADVQFIFPDTQQTYTVAAYTPSATFPVFTNATQFYVYAPNAEANDTTRFAILNTLPPPVALPLSIEQQTEVFNDIAVASGSTQIVPSTVSGSMEALVVAFQFVATGCNVQWKLIDGSATPVTLAGGQAAASPQANDNANIISFNLSGLRVRFVNGVSLVMTITGSGTNALCAVNLYYRTP